MLTEFLWMSTTQSSMEGRCGNMPTKKQKILRKTLTSFNHNVALKWFQEYNSPDWPDHFATISKRNNEKEGKTEYVVKVYELYEQSF